MSDIRNSDIELMAAIIGKSASLFRQHYPGGEFHVIFQDEPDSWRSDAIIDQLEARNIQAHRVSAILPDYFARQADYLIEHDGHPNRLTHRLLADYVGKRVIRQDNRLESTSRKILTVR
jgi:hypothetical protein